jgi:2-methylfumaryl-CoA isomerase
VLILKDETSSTRSPASGPPAQLTVSTNAPLLPALSPSLHSRMAHRHVAAPLGGMTLAQLGADVIRVDPPGGAPDHARWPLARSGASLYWAGLNKGRRSIMVDMRSASGREVILGLLRACPYRTAVVLTNAGQDWLSHDSLAGYCQDLIHVRVEGTSTGESAVDYTVNAEAGFPMVTGPEEHGGPVNHVLPAWDIACGLYAV